MECKLYIVKKVAFENVAQHKDLSLSFQTPGRYYTFLCDS